MKRIIVMLAAVALIAPVFGKTQYSFLKPDKHGKTVKIQVKGKNWTYYRLDSKHPLEVIVEGPTTIKVISRLNMKKYKGTDKIDYRIYCLRDNKKTHFTRSAVLSKGIKFAKSGEGSLGTGEHFNLKIESGKHKIKLYLDANDDKQVYVRLLKEGTQTISKTERVAIHPQEFTKQVKILVKEKEFEYYRVGSEDSLSLKIIGPATVKVLSRLEYNITMNGSKKYRVQVYEDGNLKNTFLISTGLSETAVYDKKNSGLKLSRGDDFYIEVPEGEHNYTFKAPDNNRSILLKFYIPVSDLDNTLN